VDRWLLWSLDNLGANNSAQSGSFLFACIPVEGIREMVFREDCGKDWSKEPCPAANPDSLARLLTLSGELYAGARCELGGAPGRIYILEYQAS